MKKLAIVVAFAAITLGILLFAWVAAWSTIQNPKLQGTAYWAGFLRSMFRPDGLWAICVSGTCIYLGVITLIWNERASRDESGSHQTRNAIIVATALIILFTVGSLYLGSTLSR
jgi:hypothetical protein